MRANMLLQALQARKTAQVAGVLSQGVPARAQAVLEKPAHVRPPNDADRIRALPEWSIEDYRDLDLTSEFRKPGGTMQLTRIQSLALHWIRKAGGLLGPLSVGSGKCISGKTQVWDVLTGRYRRVDEIAASSEPRLSVLAMAGQDGKLTPQQAVAAASGIKPCVKVTLAAGHALELSRDHKVFTHKGWVDADHLTSNHLVATPRSYPKPKRQLEGVDDDEIVLVAYLMADGGCSNGGAYFTNMDPKVMGEFEEVVNALGVPDKAHKKVGIAVCKSQSSGQAITVYARGVRHIIERWKIGTLSKVKRLPAEFFVWRTNRSACF